MKSTDSVKEATRSLATHGILSAPVRKADAKEDDAWLEKYMVSSAGTALLVLSHRFYRLALSATRPWRNALPLCTPA